MFQLTSGEEMFDTEAYDIAAFDVQSWDMFVFTVLTSPGRTLLVQSDWRHLQIAYDLRENEV